MGNFAAAFPAVPFGRLHYRMTERDKIAVLRAARGNFDRPCYLGLEAKAEICWWIDNVIDISRPIKVKPIDLTIYTDASKMGWGVTNQVSSTGGLWSPSEKDNYINLLELKAIELGLKTYCENHDLGHVRIYSDNTTAISY